MMKTAIARFVAAALAFALPAAVPAQDPAGAAPGVARTETARAAAHAEAAAFMAAYGRELIAGDRAAIARRYHRGGAWRVGHGLKSFESWPAIEGFYAGEHWARPASFEWQDLSYEVLGPDAVVVVGLFRWRLAAGGEPLTLSYTALLVRQDGELRIRLEDESAARGE
jgi:hypothetical protein